MERYVAYIDESGDHSVGPIKPGGSAWFILGCVVVREKHIPTLANAHAEALEKFTHRQTDFLHFNRMSPSRKFITCRTLAATPCRAVTVISNKINILNRCTLAISENKDWLYWWLTRLLMERVTDLCKRHSLSVGDGHAEVKFVFSRRDNNSYEHLKKYLARIRSQSEAGALFVNNGDIVWDVVNLDKIVDVPAKNSIGLQFADTVAGAFFNSLEIGTSRFNPEYAKILKPIVASCKNGRRMNFGVKTMPYLREIVLAEPQKEIFAHYGYKDRWALGSG